MLALNSGQWAVPSQLGGPPFTGRLGRHLHGGFLCQHGESFLLTLVPNSRFVFVPQAKVEMLDNLLDIEVAYSLLRGGSDDSTKDPIDVNYEKLKTDIKVRPPFPSSLTTCPTSGSPRLECVPGPPGELPETDCWGPEWPFRQVPDLAAGGPLRTTEPFTCK